MQLHGRLFPATLAILLWLPNSIVAAAANDVLLVPPATNRLTIAILGFENKTGDSSNAFWRFAIEGLISRQLDEVKSLRLLPSVDYALRQIHKKDGDPIDVEQAANAGRFIEARRVIWGSYQRKHKQWVVTARVLNTATGKVSRDLTVSSSNWFDIGDQLIEKILNELAIQPSAAERQKMSRRFTTSPVAFEWFVKACALHEGKTSLDQLEPYVRQALAEDPRYAEAHRILAAILGNQGKFDSAEKAVHQALQLRPDYAEAYLDLGVILLIQGRYENAETALLEAARLDRDSVETWERLGELRGIQNSQVQMIDYLNRALQLNPFSATVHAQIAALYTLQGQREQAINELKKAEQFASPDDTGDEQTVGQAFDGLHETSSAITHYENFITVAREEGLNPGAVDTVETRLHQLKDSLTPVYLVAAQPKNYTGTAMAEILHQKLTSEELTLVTNPLVSTPEMDRWAHKVTLGATNELEKAKMLFDALNHHVDEGTEGWRTAQETFALWDAPGISFLCQEYAFLYISLARTIGLKSFDVFVEEDCNGKTVLHACAAVFLNGKVLLVDPMYHWFGVRHKKFTVLDDLQITALYLSCHPKHWQMAQIAAKIDPHSDLVQFTAANALATAGHKTDARQIFSSCFGPDKEGWLADCARAQIALIDDHLETAIGFLQKAVKENPACGPAFSELGDTFWKQGKLKDARANYRNALGCWLRKEVSDQTRAAIAEINETLGDSNPDTQPNPVNAADYVFRGDARARNGELEKAVSDYNKAIQLDPKNASAFSRRGYVSTLQSNLDNALLDYTEAIRLNPSQAETYGYRATVYFQKNEFDKAMNDAREAIRLEPGDAAPYAALAWYFFDSPEPHLQYSKEALAAAKKACELSAWQNSAYIYTLAAVFGTVGDFDQAITYGKKAVSFHDLTVENRQDYEKWLAYWQGMLTYRSLQNPKPPN